MKKIIMAFVCLMTMVMSASAQNGWDSKVYPKDELKGEEGYVSTFWSNASGMVVTFSDNGMKLCTNSGIFDYYDDRVNVTIGYYDLEGNLKEKASVTFYISQNSSQCFIANASKKKKGKKFRDFIHNEKGYVRIVAPRYARSDFDIKVPCMNN